MSVAKIREYLDSQDVTYQIISHPQAFTAQETAALSHFSGDRLAKTVIVKLDGKLAMAVLPASYRVDFKALRLATGATEVALASEQEFKDLFPDCEVGAMPPLGHLYGIDLFVDEQLAKEMVIAFCAGTHSELVQLSFEEFARIAEPKVAKFSLGS